MGVFDKFVNRAKTSAQVAGQKATELVEATKLGLSISETKDEIQKVYNEIGKMVYDAYKDKDTSTEELNEKCELIDEKLLKIKEMQDKLNLFKNVKECENCGAANEMEDVFCAKCGVKLPEALKEDIIVEDFVVENEPQETQAEDAPQDEDACEEKTEQ